MKTHGGDFRPFWISCMGYVASVSKILQSVKRTGNDHGTGMALLMFNAEGERRLPEPKPPECEATREVTAKMGKVSEIREVERLIPRVQFATDIYLIKLSLAMKYIAA